MAERLRARYRGVMNTAILSNAAFFAPAPAPRMSDDSPFQIGFLSNLNPEKGLDTVVEVFRALRARQLDIRLTIAGPVTGAHAQVLLDDALSEFGDAVEYRGALYGEGKADFFRALDLFLFPTRYPNEAEPLVLLEALAAGVPVIATRRGCIADDFTSDASAVIPEDQFVATVVPMIAGWLADRTQATKRSTAALYRAAELHRVARAQLDRLLAAITLTERPVEGTDT
jgi:glycosyltransferase involved in cell wall biosynthesis